MDSTQERALKMLKPPWWTASLLLQHMVDELPESRTLSECVKVGIRTRGERFVDGIFLKVYPKSLEIWNSGALPEGWSQRKLHESHPSIPNNPDIAHFLYPRGLMERVGRGTLKILEACRQAKLPEPKWESADGVKLTFFAPVSADELKARLNDRQQKFLESAPKGTAYAPKHYREEFAAEVGDRTARRDLEEMESAGLLRREGKGPATVYIRT